MKVFLTGGMGFIGSWVTKKLIESGYEVTILARNPEKIKLFNKMPGISILKGGLEDTEIIEKNLQDHDVCIHNALFWGNSALEMLEKDTKHSVFMFEAAGKVGIKHFVYTSSTAALGEFRNYMHEESSLRPTDYYGATKAACEGFLLAASRKHTMRCSIIRPGYTFGNPVLPGAPMEIDERFRHIVALALSGKAIELEKHDGTQFIWAGDLSKVFHAVLKSTSNRTVYYGLSQEYITWEKIARRVIELTNSASKLYINKNNGSAEPYLFDVRRIHDEFGLSFQAWEKIEEHLDFLIKNHDSRPGVKQPAT